MGRSIGLVSALFSQISYQFGGCISHNRFVYASVTKDPQISLASNNISVFLTHAECPLKMVGGSAHWSHSRIQTNGGATILSILGHCSEERDLERVSYQQLSKSSM